MLHLSLIHNKCAAINTATIPDMHVWGKIGQESVRYKTCFYNLSSCTLQSFFSKMNICCLFLFKFCACMCVCVQIYACERRCQQRPEEGVRSPGVTGSCKQPHGALGIEPFSAKGYTFFTPELSLPPPYFAF